MRFPSSITRLVVSDMGRESTEKKTRIEQSSKIKPDQAVDQSGTAATMRKARVSVRARSESPMSEVIVGKLIDIQISSTMRGRSNNLDNTYEGNHNHPLPPAAVAMASTTKAATTMLLSGSMPSADGMMMNPNLLPCSSMATVSASGPFPTVTLDLTHSPNDLQGQRPNTQSPQVLFGQALCNQSKFTGLQLSQDTVSSSQLQQPQLADTVRAATVAMANDPNFTAALAAALTSIIGGAHPNSSGNTSNGTNSRQ
ncbi:aspartic proteinase isoform 2 [Hibiscus syriacus]|uniref:Aspartic proteinase isoform 2 n=1 Tax=Hibiscus syriacus TaxID=106335 RepID=A0A6A2Z3D5_HIBSY|nr:aspartic proteinase isoform 2 [Hibiscus syriacus]